MSSDTVAPPERPSTSGLVQRLKGGFEPRRIITKKHPWRVVAAVVVVVLALSLLQTVVTAPGFGWPTVGQYLFSPRILLGVVTTLWLTAAVMAIAIVVGLLIATMERSANPLLRIAAVGYVWLFRSVPTLVQLLLWFNIALLFPNFSLGIPFTDIVFFSVSANSIMTPILAALLGLSLSEGAYMAEIVRSGLNSVDRGQHEAAWALGLGTRKTFFKVTLPQSIRTIIPPTGNQVIGMLKYTSLASVISVSELLFSAQQIAAVNFQIIPLLLVASIWYLVLSSILQVVQDRIERRFNRGVAGAKQSRRPSAKSQKSATVPVEQKS
ncbi:amino acid ABC transporter permease [Cnuibacter physcomitrellae]|uniref:amino acid ABC transporter permease n=1 Tax=Cnuibacter physcomitrellae TaxID=1619308 RepID=UPI002175E69E|nr:amino acid ABC transporter permease [Cnuibacter physcomitrellae]MCS5498289.1 amino acid ABC transporter permease [Cnuibacter physcomitrellae]